MINSLAQAQSSMDYSKIGETIKEQTQNQYSKLTNGILVFQLVLLVFLAYCGFKTGYHYNRNN